MNSASPTPDLSGVHSTSQLDVNDLRIVDNVEESLERGILLREWWRVTNARQGFAQQFNLIRSFNRPSSANGFFDVVDLNGTSVPVMGVAQEMLYDRPDTGALSILPAIRAELREFVTQYFMRVSDFRQPEAAIDSCPPCSQSSGWLSWCSGTEPTWEGFGYEQLYYKLRDCGKIRKFAEESRYQIVDIRSLDTKFEWIVLKVRILDFHLTFRPLGRGLPAISIPQLEDTYVILHKDFITIREGGQDGICGEYGFGYAILRLKRAQSVLAYGPGHFNVGFQTVNFQLHPDGRISVALVFVVNRPQRILEFPLNPLEWGFAFADLIAPDTVSSTFSPLRQIAMHYLPSFGTFDPLLTYTWLANVLTGGEAGKRFCISKEQLEKEMLVQHFMQHYQMVIGSLLTWRQIPDWLDSRNLPSWVIHGTPV